MYVARAGTTVWQMSTSGTGGLGFPVGCTSDQAKLAVSMTDAWYGRQNAAAVSTPAIPGPRVVKLTRASVWTPPLTNIITLFMQLGTAGLPGFLSICATQIGGCNYSVRHPQAISICLITQKGAMIKISAETNGPSASWQHPVLPFGR
jgi:hypothetical protein